MQVLHYPITAGRPGKPQHKDVMEEAERLVMSGVKELLVVSQDTSAYGLDIKYQGGTWAGVEHRSHVTDLAKAMRHLVGARAQGFYGARLHYIYPYPHVDALPEIMADDRSGLLPYLDIPFQHAHPDVLRSMARPAKQDKVLERIHKWRQDCPDLSIRSTLSSGTQARLKSSSILTGLGPRSRHRPRRLLPI